MSVHVLSWVMQHSPAKHGDRLVLFVLADQARSNDGMSCYPSVSTIMRDARLSERSVRTSLRNLETAGLIRTRINGSPVGTNDYQVLMTPEASETGAKSAPPKTDTPPVESVTEGGNPGTKSAPEPSTNQHLTVRTKTSPSTSVEDMSTFDTFWNVYPRRVGKLDAARVFDRQVKKHGSDVIMAGVTRMATDPNLPPVEFIPHPATWLHRGGWNDEPYPVRTNGYRQEVQPVNGHGKATTKATDWFTVDRPDQPPGATAAIRGGRP